MQLYTTVVSIARVIIREFLVFKADIKEAIFITCVIVLFTCLLIPCTYLFLSAFVQVFNSFSLEMYFLKLLQ